MQVHNKKEQGKIIQELQSQVDKLTAENLLLQEQLARKEQFTAMIAHELRSPLSPIINYAQMLARLTRPTKESDLVSAQKTRQNEAIQRHTKIIISQARRLTRLVNDLLDASRLTSNQFRLQKAPCDLVELTQELVEQLRPVAPYHQLVINTQETTIEGNWDGGRLQQVLGNLIDNAIKYSDEHTTITVSILLRDAEHVCVNVHNQGASIPSAEISQLFRPYTRLSASSGREGSGLGLYITKSIIEAHAGSLHLEPHNEESSNDGARGTTFTFELPLSV